MGNAPQTQVSAAVSPFPLEGMSIQGIGKRFARFWAAFEPSDRTDETDRAQSWRIPGYTVFDGHFSYTLPESFRLGQRLTIVWARLQSVGRGVHYGCHRQRTVQRV